MIEFNFFRQTTLNMIELTSRAKQIILLGSVGGSLVGGLVLWKDHNKYQMKGNIENKVFIVTGANSGIGRETVHELARRKGRVYMACRDLNKCEEERTKIVLDTKNKFVYCRKCDLSSTQSIREFVKQFEGQEKNCDVLINNAGVMKCRKSLTSDGIESQLGVNYMGHLLLTQSLKSMLKSSSGGGRVIYLMNLDYRKGEINLEDLNSDKEYDPGVAFNQSQLANMLTVSYLAKKWRDDNISINAVYPGVCSTNIKRHMGVDKSISGNFIANPIMWLMTRSAARGAHTVLWSATDPELAGVTGKLFSNMKQMNVDGKASNDDLARKIIAVGQFWTGLESKESIEQSLKERR